eukprot:GHUV01006168.1.p1 GENE.GHUV01006168.1~~GHUV01006168.1.p1  ORF type:complete len:415 (-),score=87.89 GHUV01006168.1:1971-3215(-)
MDQFDDDNFAAEQPAGVYQPTNPPAPSAVNGVEKYDGHSDAHAWLTSYNEYADLYNWNGDHRTTVAKLRMRGPAQNWVQSRKFHNWTDFQTAFLHKFGVTQETAVTLLEKCKQTTRESVNEYAERFMREAERAGRLGSDGPDMALVYQFASGLHEYLQVEVKRKELRSIDAIVKFCNYWDGCNIPDSVLPARTVKFDDPIVSGYSKPPPTGRNNGVQHSMPRYEQRRPEQRPRFNDRPYYAAPQKPFRPAFRETTNNHQPPRPPTPKPSATEPQPKSQDGIDELTKKFDKLELNLRQRYMDELQDKDKELRYLRHALKQSQPSGAPSQLNLLEIQTTSDVQESLNYLEDMSECESWSGDDEHPDYLPSYSPTSWEDEESYDLAPNNIQPQHHQLPIACIMLKPLPILTVITQRS